MIQDIFPHRLYNEYRPEASADRKSTILCFDKDRMLVKMTDCLVYPVLSDFDKETVHPVYAFCIDDTEYYLDISMNRHDIAGFEYAGIRSLRSICNNMDGMIMFTGNHLYQWYSQSRFCGCCGAVTEEDPAERAMTCPSCGHKIYPRLQPAVIAGVTDGDRLLVTKYRNGINHFALVAGFSEIGETLEETVRREVMEETGLQVKNIRYYKSQPWGIAQDILAGFYCEADGNTEISLDQNELKLAQWRKREEIELQPDSYSLTNEMMKVFKENKEPF